MNKNLVYSETEQVKLKEMSKNKKLCDVLNDFFKMRLIKTKSNFITQEYLHVFLEKLDKFSNGEDSKKIELLKTAIEHEWINIYEPLKTAEYQKGSFEEVTYDLEQYEKDTNCDEYLKLFLSDDVKLDKPLSQLCEVINDN